MEHAEARELLDTAAIEPGGFDRLAAGDTAEASALAGHLAGCLECADEMERLRHASGLIRDVVQTTAPPDLRDRTLAFVAAVGRDRTAAAVGGSAAASATVPASAARGTSEPPEPIPLDDARRARTAGVGRLALWATTIAAAVVLSIVALQLLVVAPRDARIADQGDDIAAVAKAAAWSLAISGAADAEHVALTATGGDTDASGTLLYSPGSEQLVVLAQGLEQPPPGMEYRCWVESGGVRTPIGKMFFAGDVAYWVGPVPSIDAAGEDATFGVSPSPDSNPTDVSADPVLTSEPG